MRFVLAIVLFVCALASAGYGIAQRTVLAGPDQLTVKAEVRSDAPITVISGKTLSSVGGAQQLTVSGGDEVNLAYGRTADVMAWVGESSYNTVSFNAEKKTLAGKTVDGSDSDAIPRQSAATSGSTRSAASRASTGRSSSRATTRSS